MIPERRTLTVSEAARVLGISRAAAYAAAKSGAIPTITIGRRILVPLPALERLLEGQPSD
jgi:excisionase family DNA binding protein